jgi:transposase
MGVPGITQSNLPEHIANAEVESDEEMGTVVDCGGKDAGEDVCRIKKAEDKQGDGAQALTTQDT